MNYWHIQLHPEKPDQTIDETKKLLRSRGGIIGCGDKGEEDSKEKEFKKLNVGDIVLVHNKDYHALVEVKGGFENNDNRREVWFHYIRRVKILDECLSKNIRNDFEKIYNEKWTTNLYIRKTLGQINDKGYIKYWHQKILKQQQMKNYIDILKSKKQIILQGAPGTGKTYTSAEIAMKLIDGKEYTDRDKLMDAYKQAEQNGQIAFTTFHQSLDYEEFVEGYKPETDENGHMVYEVKDGIFKRVCAKAKDTQKGFDKHNFDEALEKLKEEVWEKGEINLETKWGEKFTICRVTKRYFRISIPHIKRDNYLSFQSIKTAYQEVAEYGCYVVAVCEYLKEKYGLKGNQNFEEALEKLEAEVEEKEKITLKTKTKIEFTLIKKKDYAFKVLTNQNTEYFLHNRTIKDTYQNGFKGGNSYAFAVSKYLKEKYGLKEFIDNENTDIKDQEKNHILIIDEINRGNISKILGELITLLEADKRAGAPNEISVTLPYSGEKFSVPSNVYIIGTMNTADRSIGTIDYAVRRRFAFIELKADREAIENYYTDKKWDGKEALELFDTVEKIFDDKNISPDVKAADIKVGHSYFMAKDKTELKLKLEYEIKPLLLEYLKDGVLIGDGLENEINDLSV